MARKSRTVATPTPTTDAEFRAAWTQRVKSMSDAQQQRDLRELRVMGISGDETVYIPFVPSLEALEQDPVAAWAVREAEAIITAKREDAVRKGTSPVPVQAVSRQRGADGFRPARIL